MIFILSAIKLPQHIFHIVLPHQKISQLYGKREYHINHEVKYKMRKVTIPSFDGSSQMFASAWLQKLSVYFQLNPMVEEDALKMAILHLEGESSDWCVHGIITLGNYHILSYEVFSHALMEIFERKDPEIPFKELAQFVRIVESI